MEKAERISHFESLLSEKKEFIGKQVVNTILLFIILIVFGCLDFAKLEVHLDYLLQLSYWANVLTKVIAYLCAYNVGINMIWEAEVKKSSTLKQAILDYEMLIKYKQIDFEYYITAIFNPQEKKKAYISQINRKIHLLNRFSKAKNRLLYSSVLPENEAKKLTNRYCIKRKELEDLKNEEYIARNIESLKVKYYEVDPTLFDLGIDGSIVIKGLKVKGNTAMGRTKASSSIILSTIAVSMFLASFGLSLNTQEFVNKTEAFLHYLIKCATDVALLLWKFLGGMKQAKKIISAEITTPYVNRVKILKLYLEWRLQTNQPNSLVYDEMNKPQEEEIELELTPEQLIALQQAKDNKPIETE